MFRRRSVLLITMSLLMGVGAAWVANNWVRAGLEKEEESRTTVVAAAIAIPFGTKVEQRHLKTITMPVDARPPGSFTEIAAVEGKVTTQQIVSGEILMQERFVDHDDGSTLAAMVAEHMRAVTVRVDDVIGVAGFLLPGNHVDVLASRRERNRAVTKTILTNVKVLAVDQTAATTENEPVIVRAVTLEVSPEQAEELVKGKTEGTLQLTLRNPLDDEVPVVEPEPAPVKRVVKRAAPRRTPTVTVIRGTRVSETKTKS